MLSKKLDENNSIEGRKHKRGKRERDDREEGEREREGGQ